MLFDYGLEGRSWKLLAPAGPFSPCVRSGNAANNFWLAFNWTNQTNVNRQRRGPLQGGAHGLKPSHFIVHPKVQILSFTHRQVVPS